MRCKHLAPKLTKLFEPCTKILGQLHIDLAAEALRKGRAFSSGRDGNLKIASADHGTKEEIAVGNVVHAVAEDIARHSLAVNSGVDRGRISRRDDEEVSVEIGRFEGALNPLELPFLSQLANLRPCFGRNKAQRQPGLEQRAYFVQRDVARAHQQAAAAFELEEDWQ